MIQKKTGLQKITEYAEASASELSELQAETFIGIRNRAGWNFGHLAELRIYYIYMAAMRC